jgi:NCAIR mutase (PurE)-related protein
MGAPKLFRKFTVNVAPLNTTQLRQLLNEVQSGACQTEDAHAAIMAALNAPPFEDLGFARVDHHRAARQGFPEVVFCESKTAVQVAEIAARIHGAGSTLLATRATATIFDAVQARVPTAQWDETARLIFAPGADMPSLPGVAGVLCAGTSDLPIAEEAARSLEIMGARVHRLCDVGVAGVHRLLAEMETIRACDVLIVCAGMEGALPSVVGGLVDAPVVAVPTSVGYGASFGGVAALLGMLNTCASGVAVMNIDNGFGAAAFAASILRRINHE